jgi:hypothetical protein
MVNKPRVEMQRRSMVSPDGLALAITMFATPTPKAIGQLATASVADTWIWYLENRFQVSQKHWTGDPKWTQGDEADTLEETAEAIRT